LAFVFLVFSLLGHWLWGKLAGLFNNNSWKSGQLDQARFTGSCPRCKKEIAPESKECPHCNLLQSSAEAVELNDLDATARQLSRFEESGLLNQVILSRLRTALRIRRRRLHQAESAESPGRESSVVPMEIAGEAPSTPGSGPASRDEPIDVPPELITTPTFLEPWQRLENLLRQRGDVRELSSSERVNALLWYGRCEEQHLARLTWPVQLALARMLWLCKRWSDSLRAYWRLLTTRAEDLGFAEAALEAGRRAHQANDLDQAAWFLQRALSRWLPPEGKREAEELLRRLRPLAPVVVEEGIPTSSAEVLPTQSGPGPGEPQTGPVPAAAGGWPASAERSPREEPAPSLAFSAREDARPPAAGPEPPPRPPRRSLGEILAAFMEERNILWGELVGGLLIVGCSIALVISLWKTLEQIPYFPFLIFAAITTALFGAGLYTLHHWKLQATSRCLLVIATLLVPLDFLIMAGLRIGEAGDPKALLINAACLVVFAWLLSQAARVFAPEGRWLLPLAILGTSAGQLVVPLLSGKAAPGLWNIFFIGIFLVAFFGMGLGGVLWKVARKLPFQGSSVTTVFASLGMASFALAIPLGFLVFWGSQTELEFGTVLNALAPVVALAGIPVLASGFLVHRGLEGSKETAPGSVSTPECADHAVVQGGTSTTETPRSPEAYEAAWRTWGTGVTLLGFLIMLVGVVLAWPQPAILTAVCALDFVVFTALAFRYQLLLAHAAGIPCLLVGYLAGLSWVSGELAEVSYRELGQSLSEITLDWGGTVLVFLVLGLAIAAEICARVNYRKHAAWYAIGSAGIALLSWALVTVNGLEQPDQGALVSAVYAAGALILNLRWRRSLASYFGLGLLATATLWGLEWAAPVLNPLMNRIDPTVRPGHLAVWCAGFALEALILAGIATCLCLGTWKIWRGWPAADAPGSAQAPSIPAHQFLSRPLINTSEGVAWVVVVLGLLSGWLLPWQGGHVIAGSFLLVQYVLLAVAVRSIGLAQHAGWLLIGTVVAAAGWAAALKAGSPWNIPNLAALIGLCLASASTVMAAVSVLATRRLRAGPEGAGGGAVMISPSWYSLFGPAWREMSAVAAVLGFGLTLVPSDTAGTGLHTAVFAVLAATAFLLSLRYQEVWLTWLGSILVLGSLLHACYWNALWLLWPDRILAAFLVHATLGLVAGLIITRRAHDSAAPWHRLFGETFFQAGLLSTWLTLPLLLTVQYRHNVVLAGCAGWLATMWLVFAWVRRSPWLFTCYQVAMTGAFVYAITAWLEGKGWLIDNYPEGLTDPRSFQAYAIGLGLVGLVWVIIRLGLRKDSKSQELLEPPWPSPDRVVLGVLVVGQLVLAVWGIGSEVLKELVPRGMVLDLEVPRSHVFAYGRRAWWLFAVLAGVLIPSLWDRKSSLAVLGLVVLAVTVPVLLAGRFATYLATASALRWGLSGCFLFCAVFLWVRTPLARLAGRLGIQAQAPFSLPVLVNTLLLVCLCAPLLSLSYAMAMVRYLGEQTTGPAQDSVFADIPLVLSFAGPLVILCVAQVGHALRERSALDAFTAGLVANLTLMGGYALAFVRPDGTLPAVDWVRMGQLGVVGAAAWALAWLLSRPRVAAWRAGPEAPLSRPLMSLQIRMGIAGQALLLLAALWFLIMDFRLRAADFGPEALYGRVPLWVIEIGSVLGWAALALVIVAALLRNYPQAVSIPARAIGLVVLAEVALLGCTLEGLGPGWGYRGFMIGCGLWALAVSLGAWGIEKRTALEQRTGLPEATASLWVRITGGVLLFMGLKAAFWHQDHLWAAAAIALVSLAGAALAVWHRREDRAFTSGLGVNLAASLVIWHFHRSERLENWLFVLIQANVIANAICTLLWLGVRKRLYTPADLARISGPFLVIQVVLGFLGNAIWLLDPLADLLIEPGDLPKNLSEVGNIWGWAALLLAMAAAGWYVIQSASRTGVHLVGGLALALGVLLAATVSRWDTGNWLSYHVLTAAWIIAGMLLLVAGWRSSRWAIPITSQADAETGPAEESVPWLVKLPVKQIQAWVASIGILGVLLAVRGVQEDPQRPYWSGAATLAVSGLAGTLALWSSQPLGVYVSGLLINLAGIILWIAWGPHTLAAFVSTNIICLGAGSVCWLALYLILGSNTRFPDRRAAYLPYSHAAILVGLCLQALVVLFGIASDFAGEGWHLADPLAWTSLAVLSTALIISLWDSRARFTLPGLYAAGLFGFALGLHGAELSPRQLGWHSMLMLATYVFFTAIVGWLAPHFESFWQSLRLPKPAHPWPRLWFPITQAIAGGVVIALSLWVCLGFATPTGRLGGKLALALLLPAGVLLADLTRGRWTSVFRLASLALGAAALTEGGWALLPRGDPAPWLHRSVIAICVMGGLAFVYRALLPRLIPSALWSASARRLGTVLGGVASALLLVILLQEALLYDLQAKTTPLGVPGIIIVAAGLVVLMVLVICFAVLPAWDPLQLSEPRRTLYVYGCEILLVLLFVHLRLNVPWLFGTFAAKYWTMIVMAISFLGVGLSELFARKNLPVLAEPLQRTGLFLPLLPLLAFWFQPPPEVRAFAQEHAPGFEPLLRPVKRAPGGFASYGFLWFASGLLYTLVAVSKRSFWFALLAALAVNFGLWSMLYHYGWKFLIHPQLWVIPLALILLVCEHVNRDRLTRGQSLSLRYLAVGSLYLSSTADMFITGVGNSVILPLVLAVLALLGVLAGIILRVRAFLFLGVGFLALDIFSMIWHAAVDRTQTWVWWASGIVLGIGIVALFAVFEKRRNEVLRLIEEIKKWH
jgi:hypothetical protein